MEDTVMAMDMALIGYFDDDTRPTNGLTRWFGWMDAKKWKGTKRKRTKV